MIIQSNNNIDMRINKCLPSVVVTNIIVLRTIHNDSFVEQFKSYVVYGCFLTITYAWQFNVCRAVLFFEDLTLIPMWTLVLVSFHFLNLHFPILFVWK